MIYKCNEPECDKEYESYNSLFVHKKLKHGYVAQNITKPKANYLTELKSELEKIRASIPQNNNNKETIVEKSESTRTGNNKEPDDSKTGFYFLAFLLGMSLVLVLWQKGFFNTFILTE